MRCATVSAVELTPLESVQVQLPVSHPCTVSGAPEQLVTFQVSVTLLLRFTVTSGLFTPRG